MLDKGEYTGYNLNRKGINDTIIKLTNMMRHKQHLFQD